MEHDITKSAELRFGKYHLIATLGQGGMADVFLAATQGPAGFSKLQVIKRLRRSEIGDEHEIVTMFLDEARLAARLNHPNVVQTNEVGEVDGEYFIAMEYLDGQPLNRIIQRLRQRGPQDERTESVLLRVVADVLAGLHYAHELTDYDGTPLHVVHRDASPHNVFVTYEGHTKVVDFGIAKAATRSSQTTAGVLKGKLSYMAPEQARARQVDRRADIFVIGILLWEVLAGRKMWKGLADMEIVNKIFTEEIPNIEDVRADLPEDLLRIVHRALAYDADDRYATAAEMRADLLSHLERTGQRVATEEIGQLISQLFADRRAHLQTVIDGQIKRLRTMGGAPLLDVNTTMPPPSGHSSQSSSGTMRTGTPPSGATPLRSEPLPNLSYPAPDAASSVTRQSPMAQERPPTRRLIYPALAAAAAVGLVGLLLLRGGAPAATTAPPGPAGEQAQAAPAAPTGQQPAAQPAAAPRTIEVRISASPASAKIYLDDVELETNPFTGRFPADGVRHLVRVVAGGYATQREFANFADDVTMEFDLEKRTSATVSYRPRPAAESAGSDPYPTPTPSEPAAAEEPQQPGGSAKPKRSLSGSDPWSGTPASAPQPATTGTSTKPKRSLSGSDPWAN